MRSRLLKSAHRFLVTVVATSTVALSAAVPMLDDLDRNQGPVLESEHNASTCLRVHDHTLCTQFSANRPLAGHAPRHAGMSGHSAELGHLHHDLSVTPAALAAHNSRAPPLS